MPRHALPPLSALFAPPERTWSIHAAHALALLLLALPGCASARLKAARALPQVIVRARLGYSPRSVAVEGFAAFPLRRVTTSGALATAQTLDEDESAPSGLDGGGGGPESKGPFAAAQHEAACLRPDTCAWQRERVARVIAAWGAAR